MKILGPFLGKVQYYLLVGFRIRKIILRIKICQQSRDNVYRVRSARQRMIGLKIRNHTVHKYSIYRAIFRNIPLEGIISHKTVSLQGK